MPLTNNNGLGEERSWEERGRKSFQMSNLEPLRLGTDGG